MSRSSARRHKKSRSRRILLQVCGLATPPSAALPRQPPIPVRLPQALGTLDLCQRSRALHRSQHNLGVIPARLDATVLVVMLRSRGTLLP